MHSWDRKCGPNEERGAEVGEDERGEEAPGGPRAAPRGGAAPSVLPAVGLAGAAAAVLLGLALASPLERRATPAGAPDAARSPGRLAAPLAASGARQPDACCGRETRSDDPRAQTPSRPLAGVVLDARRRPVAGAHVTAAAAAQPEGPPLASTMTGPDGRFELGPVPAAELLVQAERDGAARVGRLVGAGDASPIVLALEPTGTVRVQVAGGSGATVELAGTGIWPPRSAVADDRGLARFDAVPVGVYGVLARRDGHVSPELAPVPVDEAHETLVARSLAPAVRVSGVVIDRETSRALSGASVTVSDGAFGPAPGPGRATTDGDGRFAFEGLRPVRMEVHASADAFLDATVTFAPDGGPVTLRLERGASLVGTVLDRSGAPLGHATVSALLEPSPAAAPGTLVPSGSLGVTRGPVPLVPVGGAGVAPGPSARTDASGRFALTGLPAGPARVLVRHPAYATAEVGPVPLGSGEERVLPAITLDGAGAIEGRVVDTRGWPVGRVRVEASLPTEPLPQFVLADDDGRFRVDSALGRVRVRAFVDADAAAEETVRVEAGAVRALTLTIPDVLAELRGRVLDARGFPVEDARVSLSTSRGSPAAQRTRSATDGTFVFRGVARGAGTFHVEAPGFAARAAPWRAPADAEITIELEPGATLSATVTDAWDGEPLAGAEALLHDVGRARTDAAGLFRIEGVPAGTHALRLGAEGHLPSTVDVELSASAGVLEDLDLGPLPLERAASVSGVVVDALGAPAANVRVRCDSSPGAVAQTATDEEGGFRCDGLAPGDVTVRASDVGAGSASLVVRHVAAERPRLDLVLRLPGRLP